MTLPPGFPLWMGAVAGFTAIAMGKTLFGGLGFNIFNPALVGRAFVQAAFPVSITTWTPALAVDRFSELATISLAINMAANIKPPESSIKAGVGYLSGSSK
jgi:electron transport complex protein RnfD